MEIKDIERRKNDEHYADIVTQFMEDNFYLLYTRDYHKITNKEDQVKGIDTKFYFKDDYFQCDEKAAVRYINSKLSTFAIELSFINKNGLLNYGWLMDSNKVNNSYMFIWIDKAKNSLLQDKSDILELEMALVKRNDIINYLNSIGWTKNRLYKKMDRIRNNENEPLGDLYKNGCRFTISRNLYEQPINVLITRKNLIKISTFSKKYKTY